MFIKDKDFFISLLLISFLSLFLVINHGCGGDEESNLMNDSGTLSLAITDSAIDDLEEVWITIKEIAIHPSDGDWEIFEPANLTFPMTIELLSLQNGNLKPLGFIDLPVGYYSQIRLFLGDQIDQELQNPPPFPNCVKELDANYSELKVPSGFQSGIKLTHGFDIQPNTYHELLIDFDASLSIHKTGSKKNAKYIMRPTIKVIQKNITGSISGQTEPEARVMAQQSKEDACGGTEVVQTTISDPNGSYTLGFLDQGLYNIVVVKKGFHIEVDTNVEVLVGENSGNNDFVLTPLDPNDSYQIILGDILNIPQDTNPQAKILFTFDSLDVIADFSPINKENEDDEEGNYLLNVPPGSYTLYICAQGSDPIVDPNVIVTDEEVTKDYEFFNPL